jgi:hypothetical protein
MVRPNLTATQQWTLPSRVGCSGDVSDPQLVSRAPREGALDEVQGDRIGPLDADSRGCGEDLVSGFLDTDLRVDAESAAIHPLLPRVS